MGDKTKLKLGNLGANAKEDYVLSQFVSRVRQQHNSNIQDIEKEQSKLVRNFQEKLRKSEEMARKHERMQIHLEVVSHKAPAMSSGRYFWPTMPYMCLTNENRVYSCEGSSESVQNHVATAQNKLIVLNGLPSTHYKSNKCFINKKGVYNCKINSEDKHKPSVAKSEQQRKQIALTDAPSTPCVRSSSPISKQNKHAINGEAFDNCELNSKDECTPVSKKQSKQVALKNSHSASCVGPSSPIYKQNKLAEDEYMAVKTQSKQVVIKNQPTHESFPPVYKQEKCFMNLEEQLKTELNSENAKSRVVKVNSSEHDAIQSNSKKELAVKSNSSKHVAIQSSPPSSNHMPWVSYPPYKRNSFTPQDLDRPVTRLEIRSLMWQKTIYCPESRLRAHSAPGWARQEKAPGRIVRAQDKAALYSNISSDVLRQPCKQAQIDLQELREKRKREIYQEREAVKRFSSSLSPYKLQKIPGKWEVFDVTAYYRTLTSQK